MSGSDDAMVAYIIPKFSLIKINGHFKKNLT